jgi:hypothetical protein
MSERKLIVKYEVFISEEALDELVDFLIEVENDIALGRPKFKRLSRIFRELFSTDAEKEV